MSTAPDESTRPDGRAPSAELAELRKATRALRVHLDELPIDFNNGQSGDVFLAGLAFMSARQRYDCAESMIGSGFGGTVLGAMARSVFTDALRWLWIAEDPAARRISLLGDLLEERSRIAKTLRTSDASCTNTPRWLMPLPDVADLTGESKSWLTAPPLPTDEALLDDYLTHAPGAHAATSDRARDLLGLAGLRGAVAVLNHAGHGNYLGIQSTLTADGAIGHDLRPDHEALFMHVAAAGATATLLATSEAVAELWPHDVDKDDFLDEALCLSVAVADAARPLHKLNVAGTFTGLPKPAKATPASGIIEPGAVLTVEDLLPDVNDITAVARSAEEFTRVARSFTVDMWRDGNPLLHQAMTFGSAHSNLQTVISTYDQPGSDVMAVFAARMQLEEAARLAWRYQDGDVTKFKQRAAQYHGSFRKRVKKTVGLLTNNGVPYKDAAALFEVPANVQMGTPPLPPQVARGLGPMPSLHAMLADLGRGFSEPGWLQVGYSLLSQVVHATPIGLMHNIRWTGDTWSNEMSPEMLGLSLDVTCFSTAVLLGTSVLLLTRGDDAALAYRRAMMSAAGRVHDRARVVHGLD